MSTTIKDETGNDVKVAEILTKDKQNVILSSLKDLAVSIDKAFASGDIVEVNEIRHFLDTRLTKVTGIIRKRFDDAVDSNTNRKLVTVQRIRKAREDAKPKAKADIWSV